MLQVAPGVRVYLACRPATCASFDDCRLIAHALKTDPYSGGCSFSGESRDYLRFDLGRSGLCLFAKRLEKAIRLAPSLMAR